MPQPLSIFAIIGSATEASSNLKIVQHLQSRYAAPLSITIFNHLASLPHFHPHQTLHNPPAEVVQLRENIAAADGVIICTPEYIFAIPAALKNALEWCVATTLFTNKPVGLITASASGIKGHEELQLIMQTLGAVVTPATSLLINGIKGKVDTAGVIHTETAAALDDFATGYITLVQRTISETQ